MMAKKSTEQENLKRCYDCSNAYLMRSRTSDPIVAQCKLSGERFVAVTPFRCSRFLNNLQQRVINPMINLS